MQEPFEEHQKEFKGYYISVRIGIYGRPSRSLVCVLTSICIELFEEVERCQARRLSQIQLPPAKIASCLGSSGTSATKHVNVGCVRSLDLDTAAAAAASAVAPACFEISPHNLPETSQR